MTDTIIKGTGNSRSIKSVPNLLTLYPTYESFASALAGVGVPMDIGGLNEAGCQQIGDVLNKANLLKDATAALYGKPATAVPDDILAAIRPLITEAKNDGLKWLFGSFTRTLNDKGISRLNCPTINPKFLILIGNDVSVSSGSIGPFQVIAISPSTKGVFSYYYNQSRVSTASITWGATYVTIAYDLGTGYTDRATLYYAIGGEKT